MFVGKDVDIFSSSGDLGFVETGVYHEALWFLWYQRLGASHGRTASNGVDMIRGCKWRFLWQNVNGDLAIRALKKKE